MGVAGREGSRDERRPARDVLGIDHEKPVMRHNGADRRLTDVHGHGLRGLLA